MLSSVHVWILFKQRFLNALIGTILPKRFVTVVVTPFGSFIQTGQDDVLNTKNLPAVVDGMRKICAIQSTLLGNVSSTSSVAPSPTPTSGGPFTKETEKTKRVIAYTLGVVVLMGLFGF